jgi:adenylate cyclase
MLARLLSAYVPMDRLQVLAIGESLPDRTSGAALFADLSGFTQLTNSLARELGPQRGAEELTRHLNAIYSALIEEVHRYRGAVIAFSGDAITCWFDGDVGARATACALQMQQAMGHFASVTTPGGTQIALAMKVGVAAGSVRRFQVGDPQIQLIDTLAGATLDRLAAAEHAANKGEVLISSEVAGALGPILEVRQWREDEHGLRFAVVSDFRARIPDQPWPEVPFENFEEEQLRPWLLPPVYARLAAGQDVFLAELRPAVVLFVSFRGLDFDADDAAGEKLNTYITWVQGVVARYEGALLQLTIGDKGAYFYCSFGAPLAHEDDAARALQTALMLLQPPAELNYVRELKIGVSQGRLRTGAYGGVTRRTYGALGDEVNMAARMMQAAPVGQIYVREHIYTTAATRFAWEQLPPLKVKGRDDLLTAYRLLAPGQRQASSFQSTIYNLPLVGRTAELALFTERRQEALAKRGQIVMVVAEAGLGKSRLVVECARQALNTGMVLYSGEAQSYGTNDSYLIWESIWQGFFNLDRTAALEQQLAHLEAQLNVIDPQFVSRLPLLGAVLNLAIPDNDLTRSLDARLRKISLETLLVSCLRERAKQQPIALVLEDSQWIDPLSNDLLEAIGRAISDLPVLIIIASRPPEPPQQEPAIARLPHTTRIDLLELSSIEAAQLVLFKMQALAGDRELPAEVVAQIVERTQGNPFYVEELLNYLHTLGAFPKTAREFDTLDLPTSLSSLILSRIDQLSESQKTTLKVASVIGRLFRAAWLWGFYPQIGTSDRVKIDLDILARLDLTPVDQPEPDNVYLFKHILTHGVAYESLPYETRAWLHGQLGEYVERTYQTSADQFVDLLAFHFDRSPNEAKRREYLRRAGEAAQAAYANTAAIDYYRRLLPLLDEDQQGPVQMRLGQVLEVVGEFDEASACYQASLALAQKGGDTLAEVESRRLIGWLLRKRGAFAEALQWLREAQLGYERLGDTAGAVQSLADIGEVYRLQGSYSEARAAYDASLALSSHPDAERPLLAARANALKGAGTLANQQGDLNLARELYEQSLEMGQRLGDRPGMASLFNNLGMVAMFRGDFATSQNLFEQGLLLSRELGNRWAIGQLLNNLALAMRYNGDYEGAQRTLEDSIKVRRRLGDRWGIANSLNTLTNLLLHIGQHESVRPLLSESLSLNHEVGDTVAIVYCLEDFAGLAAAEGNSIRALQIVGASSALREQIGSGLSSGEQADFEKLLAPAYATLSTEQIEAAMAAGRAMSLEEAIAYALGEGRITDGTE